jgi:hypothetical protein
MQDARCGYQCGYIGKFSAQRTWLMSLHEVGRSRRAALLANAIRLVPSSTQICCVSMLIRSRFDSRAIKFWAEMNCCDNPKLSKDRTDCCYSTLRIQKRQPFCYVRVEHSDSGDLDAGLPVNNCLDSWKPITCCVDTGMASDMSIPHLSLAPRMSTRREISSVLAGRARL